MLRASIRTARAIGYAAANPRRQWHIAPAAGRVPAGATRGYADKPSISDSKPIVLPGSASPATNEPRPQGPVATTSSSKIAMPLTPSSTSTTPPQQVPLIPQAPAAKVQTAPPASTSSAPPPPPPSPPPAPKPRRFFRRFFTTIFLLTTLGYAGGIYYSSVNDNFHDFFTEYIPFGEDAVLYFEERQFRKKFPSIANRPQGRPRDTGDLKSIPSQSGVSWRIAEQRHANAQKPDPSRDAIQNPAEAKPNDQIKAVEKAKEEPVAKPNPPALKPAEPVEASKPGHPVAKDAAPASPALPAAISRSPEPQSFTAPEVDQPSRFPPEVTRIDPINIKDANEPLVQDLVKIVNDIIAVINSDNSNPRFSSTIGKAKDEISKVGSKVNALKDAAEKDAKAKIDASHSDFDRAAKELIRRLEGEMANQEAQWKEEYETERQNLHKNYEERLKSELERASEVHEQRLKNQLLEQAVEMKRKFIADVKDRVEEERNGRLGKLANLSDTVTELEKLTTDWTSVVDANLKTQHLHVAVEAVRSNLEKSQVPRPFTRELAALKEIASDDPVVNAAIASINPTAYQRGVPSSAQLIDRFRRVATEVRKASLLPEEAGVASHASSWVLSKVLFKKKGLATGNDVESILTRTEVLLEEGDLDGAAREMNALSGWAKTLSRDWLGEVRKVLEVQQALDVIATEARLQSLRVE
ncbi:mitochondrial inner membrane protein-domain-containing protein [Bisporella sp. PMI_857]|nr:mitochondrial inner membrane protein-domain-containing protein [Bisporella sp. PMI_857]